MEDNFAQPPDPTFFDPQPRRFVYRAAHADAHQAHPHRRSTDGPRTFLDIPRPLLFRMCVYLKVY